MKKEYAKIQLCFHFPYIYPFPRYICHIETEHFKDKKFKLKFALLI